MTERYYPKQCTDTEYIQDLRPAKRLTKITNKVEEDLYGQAEWLEEITGKSIDGINFKYIEKLTLFHVWGGALPDNMVTLVCDIKNNLLKFIEYFIDTDQIYEIYTDTHNCDLTPYCRIGNKCKLIQGDEGRYLLQMDSYDGRLVCSINDIIFIAKVEAYECI
jgi:hypothetical protein